MNSTTCISYFDPSDFQAEKGIVIACICLSVHLSIRPSGCRLYFVCMITGPRFKLELPKLHQTCIMGYFQLVLKIGVIDYELQGHFDSNF